MTALKTGESEMAALRSEIDKLDHDIVELLIARMQLIDCAGDIKSKSGIPARVPSRIKEVIANVRHHAKAGQLDPELAQRLWIELIEWSIAREEATLNKNKH